MAFIHGHPQVSGKTACLCDTKHFVCMSKEGYLPIYIYIYMNRYVNNARQGPWDAMTPGTRCEYRYIEEGEYYVRLDHFGLSMLLDYNVESWCKAMVRLLAVCNIWSVVYGWPKFKRGLICIYSNLYIIWYVEIAFIWIEGMKCMSSVLTLQYLRVSR